MTKTHKFDNSTLKIIIKKNYSDINNTFFKVVSLTGPLVTALGFRTVGLT